MKESSEPLLNTNERERTTRKNKAKSGTLKVKSNTLDHFHSKLKDSQKRKTDNKFTFKVYLHLFCQIIFIFLMIIISFRIKIINQILSTNKVLFIVFSIILFITFTYPFYSDQIFKKDPYNYLYLLVFTISLGYILCKILILLNPSEVKIGSVLLFFELIYLLIDSYISKKNNSDLTNTAPFIGLCLLFIGSIFYFIEKIRFMKLILTIGIVFLFGVYLIYDMNIIFLQVRRHFDENDYVLATMFLYIDLIQTTIELIGKFYNSCEPEKKQVKRNIEAKSLIYTGDEDYDEKYNPKNQDDKDKGDEEVTIKKTYSAKGFKVDQIIKETENENDDDSDEKNISFKNNSDKKLVFETKEEE